MSYRSASSRAAAFDQALREAMGSSVTERFDVEGAPASDPAAGTPCPERVAVDGVASVTAIGDTGFKPNDRDGVKHYPRLGVTDATGDPWVAARLQEHEHHGLAYGYGAGSSNRAAYTAEMARLARLRRWQETRG